MLPAKGRGRRRAWGCLVLAAVLAPASAALAQAPMPVPVPVPATRDDGTVTIVVVGDVGINSSNQPLDPRGGYKGGFHAWADTTSQIAADINGDLNFMNLETIVTDRSDIPPDRKDQSQPFNFRMHPEGLRHLAAKGFNLVSLANNHSMDYGVTGLKETLRHVGALRGNSIKAAAGVGMNREEASRPHTVRVKGSEVAFAAIGIVTNNLERHRAGPERPGQIAYRFDEDFAEVRRRLVGQPAALRILSIHYGYEGQVRADALQMAQWRGEAAMKDGIDIIVGHHAHVVRGVEMAGRSLIFYGLGNFLHLGTANMTRNGPCRDYGLMARVHLRKAADGRLAIRAVEAIPVTDTHYRPRRLTGEQGAVRVHVLNYLAGTLDDAAGKARGLRFTPQSDGSGLYCVPGADKDPGRIGALCRRYRPAPAIPATLLPRIASDCSR
ncbi:MAG: CapA family protein [Hyphomicrobiaceae bacterium]|nr:MAG: CapA family protein [Hyphomicrobiaceae bacterium]